MRALAYALAALLAAAVVALAAMMPLPARADAIAHSGSNWVRISARMCEDPDILAAIVANEEDPNLFRQAIVHVDGEDHAACWRVLETGAGIVLATGKRFLVPTAMLKPAKET